MNNQKRKVLAISERASSFTGFSKYYKEILTRLHSTDKFEIADLSCYSVIDDPNLFSIPWKLYCNTVSPQDPRFKEYQSSPENIWGRWRFDKTLLDFKPDIVCLPPNELILTKKEGYKPIQNIQINDEVLTHKGRFKRVTKKYKREYKGKLYKIFFNGCKEPLILTPEHPVLAFKYRKQTKGKKSFKNIYYGLEPEFIAAKDLYKKDLIVLPKILLQDDNKIEIDISELIDNFISEDNNKIKPCHDSNTNSINKFLTINEDFGELLGLIIGDGHIHDKGITISYTGNEINFVNRTIELYKQIFDLKTNYYKVKDKYMFTVHANSTILGEFFKKFNYIPYIWNNKKFIVGLVRGLIRSDGCYKRNTVSFATNNKKLAHFFRILCLTLDIPVNLQKKYKKLNNKNYISYDIEGYGTSARLLDDIAKKGKRELEEYKIPVRAPRVTQILENKYLVSSIKKIRYDNEYNGQVYNLEVEEDNSYVVQQSCVHNCSCRDLWFDSYILKSPLRRFFHFAYMPTTDSSPVRPEWIEDIIEADAIFAYNDWALEIMREESNGKANIIKSAPPGIDPTIFFPAPNNKMEQKKKMALKPDIYLIGMVARNQKRKLFPDLFIGFERFLNLCYEKGNKELAQKTYLFIHTSFPDCGWSIPLLLKERNISHKVLFSYICRNCKKWFPAYYSDAKTICPFCDGVAVMPNVELGVDENQLADIYRCLDLYSHLHLAAGAEMPIIEAASCGVPCMASDNTAVIDIIRKLNGVPLKLAHTFRELETGAYRHYTDMDYMVQKWYEFFTASDEYRNEQGKLAREGVLKWFTWDNSAKIWEDYLENCELNGLQGKWNSPSEFIQPRIRNDFNDLSNKDFVRYLILDILQKPSELYKLRTLHLLSVLNYGAEVDGRKIRQIKREEIHNAYINMVKNHNYCEEIRCGLRPLPQEDFIEYANMRIDS